MSETVFRCVSATIHHRRISRRARRSCKTIRIANERAKLTAAYANGLAVSIFAVGGLAPVFNVIYGAAPASVSAWPVLLSAGICWFVSGVLHLAARRLPRNLCP